MVEILQLLGLLNYQKFVILLLFIEGMSSGANSSVKSVQELKERMPELLMLSQFAQVVELFGEKIREY